MHLGLPFAAATMAAASIFTMETGNRPWTPQFMMKRLTKVFDEDDAACLILAGGLNHVCYSVSQGEQDQAVGYGSAYYVDTSEYIEHPLHVPLKKRSVLSAPSKRRNL